MNATLDPIPSMIDRIRHDLVGLKMPRALEALDHVVRRLEHGELSALEAIDILLSEELTLRENSRIKTALRMGRLATIKTLAGFDFTFRPSLARDRILTLAQLGFVHRHEAVHFLGPPGTGKSHLAAALGIEGYQGRKEGVFHDARRSDRFACPFRTGRMRRCLWRPCRRHGTARQTAASCRLRADRRIQLPAEAACRTHAGACSLQRPHRSPSFRPHHKRRAGGRRRILNSPCRRRRHNWGILLRHFWGNFTRH